MALQTKTFTSEKVNYYHLELVLTENSTNASSNSSEVSYKLILHAGGANFYDYAVGHEISLAGKVVSGSYRSEGAPMYSVEKNSSVLIASGTTTVAHNENGELDMSVAFSISIYKTSYTPGDISVTGKSMTLTTIARASSFGATDANIGSVSTITVVKKASSYTHSIKYAFGSLTGYVTESGGVSSTEVKMAATSIAWTIPVSFYEQIPNSKSGTCTLTLTTYSGSTQIGESKTATITATASKTECAPDVSGTVVDINETTVALTGNNTRLIRFFSTAQCTIAATAKNSSTIASKSIGGVAVSGDTREIANVESGSIVFAATDSRGYSNSWIIVKSIIPYIKLTNNATCERTDPTSGNATLVFKGEYYNGSFGSKSNSLVLKYKIDSGDEVAVEPVISGNTYTASVDLTGLTYTNTYAVVVTVSDELSSVEKSLTIKRGLPVFDWGESDFSFNVPVTVEGLAVAQIVESGTSGIWRYRKWSNGDAECWGEYTGTHQITNNYNGVYYSNTITVQYPFTFASPAILTVSGGSDNLMNWARKFALNNTTSGSFCVVANVQQDSAAVSVNLHAFGRWK